MCVLTRVQFTFIVVEQSQVGDEHIEMEKRHERIQWTKFNVNFIEWTIWYSSVSGSSFSLSLSGLHRRKPRSVCTLHQLSIRCRHCYCCCRCCCYWRNDDGIMLPFIKHNANAFRRKTYFLYARMSHISFGREQLKWSWKNDDYDCNSYEIVIFRFSSLFFATSWHGIQHHNSISVSAKRTQYTCTQTHHSLLFRHHEIG